MKEYLSHTDNVTFEVNERSCDSALQYAAMIRNIPGAIYRCRVVEDVGFVIDFMSDQIEPLSGYPASDFLDNQVRSFSSIIVPEDREKVTQALFHGIAEKKSFSVAYRIRCRNGEMKWVSERGKAQYNDEGKMLWVDGACFDITEQKRMEAKLVQSEKLKGVLETAGAVCHEMNQPLAAAMIRLQLLADDLEQDLGNRVSYLQDIQDVGGHLERMRQITQKLTNIHCYRTQEYIQGEKIIDIDQSSSSKACEVDMENDLDL